MKIPTTFELGGIQWKVVERKRLKGRLGDCDAEKAQIQLLASLPQEVKEQTFCHELTHAIVVAMGHNTDTHDEVFTDAFATFLHQALKSMKFDLN